MGYLSNADIENRLGSSAYVQLADDDGDGIADVVVVDEVRLGAEAAVNSFLARRYAAPIDTLVHTELADLLRSICLDLAEHRLRARRPPIPTEAVRMHEQAMAWLLRIADGTVSLPALTALSGPTSSGRIAAASGPARRLTEDELDAL